MSNDRGSGRSAKQIQAAPLGALFICHPAEAVRYFKRLALEREYRGDLEFMSLASAMRPGLPALMGRRAENVILDHYAAETFACDLSWGRAWDEFEMWKLRNG